MDYCDVNKFVVNRRSELSFTVKTRLCTNIFVSHKNKVQRLHKGLVYRLILTVGNTIARQDNSPTNQLAVSQVADWITRGLVNWPTTNF